MLDLRGACHHDDFSDLSSQDSGRFSLKNYPSGASTLRVHVPLRGIHDRSSVMHAHDRWSVMFWPLTMALRAPYEALSFRKQRKISHLAPSKSYTSKHIKLGYARPACSRALPEHFPSTPRALPEHFPSTARALPEHFPSTSRALPEHFPSIRKRLKIGYARPACSSASEDGCRPCCPWRRALD